MRYIDTPNFGAPSVMVQAEGEQPVVNAGEVLIKVAAAGVNRPDVIQREGNYPAPMGASLILGLEVAGEIAAVGDGETRWKVGDSVCALTNGGGYADYVAVPATQCLPIPNGLTLMEAASLPETHFTVWSNVFDRAALKAGEVFLVHGGSSGIGTAAIQLASALGARVFATAGSDEKCRACEALGAEKAINYRDQDYLDVLKEILGKRGVDVILDMVGGDYIQKNLKLAAVEGRIVNIAYLQGPVAKVNFMPVMLKRLTITGSTLRPQSELVKAKIAQRLHEVVWPLYENKTLKPVIAKEFALEDVVQAHELMESSQHIGKIMLDLR